MKKRKIRVIKPGKNKVYGISLPQELEKYTHINYTVHTSGTTIILTSGA